LRREAKISGDEGDRVRGRSQAAKVDATRRKKRKIRSRSRQL
jgi:hypothetical protein